jgi:hypothetical protein
MRRTGGVYLRRQVDVRRKSGSCAPGSASVRLVDDRGDRSGHGSLPSLNAATWPPCMQLHHMWMFFTKPP